MTKIKIMSENLANKIAAGEVVEKCASVVKELVENSIDAESTEIKVDLLDGGLSSIKISDNGIGMEHEDAILAFERHATSKLTKEDDLFFINTLGFRGEALPSIASVSEIELITCASKVGTHIIKKGGTLVLDKKIGKNRGTEITVSNLFYNTPARLKYLKSEQYELSQSVSYIEKLALAKPNIKFTLTNNERIIVKTSGSSNLLKTINEIYGLNVSSKMIEIKAMNDDFTINGYVCKPEILKSNRNDMNIFVNGRIVKNYDINKAINDAYYNYKPDKKFPIVVINIETDPTLIDVNIHPTKQDIKIAKFNNLYTLILDTIEEALKKNLLVQDALLRLPDTNEVKQSVLKVQEQEINYPFPKPSIDKGRSEVNYEEVEANNEDNQNQDNTEAGNGLKREENVQTTLDFGEEEINPEFKRLNLHPIGQIHATFIVAQNEEGMYLIDQHAADERINYEKVKEEFAKKEFYQVPMLIPITMEFPSSDYIIIKDNLAYLEELGFNIQEFGMNTININAHPSWINNDYAEETIRSIMDMIIHEINKFDRLKFEERLIQTTACKMSVKANTPLSIESMENLLKRLEECKNPYNCAHGRPSIMNFNNYELDRMFKRAMN